jgi:hypothetical protein
MIELIFAIVIIAISVMSLPMMIQTTSKGLEANIAQEAIFATSAKMMQILSFAWDKNSLDNNTSKSLDYARVIDINSYNDYKRKNKDTKAVDINSTFRIGHIRKGLHRRFFDKNENPIPGIGIEDQNTPETITAYGDDGYKFDMTLTPSIIYIDDSPSANPFILDTTAVSQSNIKMVEIETTVNGNTIILRSYACNIGEVDYNKRRY